MQNDEGGKHEPGEVIRPTAQSGTDPRAQKEQPETPTPPASSALPQTSQQPSSQQHLNPDTPVFMPSPKQEKHTVAGASVSWTASEFVAHEKNANWYGLLALAGVLGTVIIYLLTKDIVSSAMILVVTVIFGVFASRKPRVLEYVLDQSGIHIGPKFYAYGDFKSFSVFEEGSLNAVLLMPLRRFMPSLTIYYDPQDEEKIIQVLSDYLPFEERDHDMVDKLMRKVRF